MGVGGWVFLKLQHRGAKVTPTGGKKVGLMLQSKSVKSQVGRSRERVESFTLRVQDSSASMFRESANHREEIRVLQFN